MTRFLILSLVLLLLVGCALSAPTLKPGETLLQGVWSGYGISVDGQEFHTTVGVKGINCPVEIVLHEGRWYVWSPGYWDVIEQ